MGKKYSMNKIVTEIDQELIDEKSVDHEPVSSKTIERRLKEFLDKYNIKSSDLKKGSGRRNFSESEAKFIKLLIKESIDKESFAYKYVCGMGKNASLEDIANFMKNIANKLHGVLDDYELQEYITYLDQSLGYSTMKQLQRIYTLIHCLNFNMSDLIYSYQVNALEEIIAFLEKQFTIRTVDSIVNIIAVAEIHESTKEFLDDEDNIYDVGDFSIREEYEKRDIEIVKYLNENPLLKQHVENKLEKNIKDVFRLF